MRGGGGGGVKSEVDGLDGKEKDTLAGAKFVGEQVPFL